MRTCLGRERKKKLLEEITEEFQAEIARLVDRVFREKNSSGRFDLEAIEWAARDAMHGVGAGLIEKMLSTDRGWRGARIPCPCGAEAEFVGYRDKSLLNVMGEMKLARAWYSCESCGQGRAPLDAELDVDGISFTPGVRRMAGRMGARESFKAGSEDLKELASLRVNPKTVERLSEGVGEQIEGAARQERQAIVEGKIVPLAKPISKLYVAVDGTGVPARPSETAGRKGKQADGSAKTREAKLGCVFTQTRLDDKGRPVRDEDSTTYVGAIETAEAFGPRIWAEASRRGADRAEKLVVIGDGALWIWNLAEEQFPDAVQIVDLYHARERLGDLAKAAFPNDKGRQKEWRSQTRELLDDGDIDALVAKMFALKIIAPQAVKEMGAKTAYFLKNRERMQYRDFRKQGLFVGSGVVEAGCRTIVGQRLKESGMHWTVAGANKIIALRCCLLGGRWEDFWDQRCAG